MNIKSNLADAVCAVADEINILSSDINAIVRKMRDETRSFIDLTRRDKFCRNDSESDLSCYIIKIYKINSSFPAEAISRLRGRLDDIRENAGRLLAGKELLSLYRISESSYAALSGLSHKIGELCGNILPNYLSRLSEAREAGCVRSFTYDIPIGFLAILDALMFD